MNKSISPADFIDRVIKFNGRIRLYNAPDLREHCLNAVSVDTPRGIRLAKQKTSRKIDAAVALSFAALAAVIREASEPNRWPVTENPRQHEF
jgi:phage terminase large subunit-like protein